MGNGEWGMGDGVSPFAALNTPRSLGSSFPIPHSPFPIRAMCLLESEAGKRRLAGDMARAATSSEVKDLRRQAQELKEVVAEQALELRLLKKSMIADGGDEE